MSMMLRGKVRNVVMVAAVLTMALGASNLHACSTPVFRYALEWWDPAPYDVIVFHRGALSAKDLAAVETLRKKTDDEQISANMIVRTVDLAREPSLRMQKLWKSESTKELPRVIVCSPERQGHKNVVWSGSLTEISVSLIADSPKRREIVRRILTGDGIVWVFLESGDKGPDEAAVGFLRTQSKKLKRAFEQSPFPGDAIDEQDGETSSWKFSPSLVRVSRTDPVEQVFIKMLLASEPGLDRLSEKPIAFPVFGRGRLLCALVGGGINEKTIGAMAAFLTGPCSCLVKDMNPGVDLLMSADWGSVISTEITDQQGFGPLIAVLPESRTEAVADGNLARSSAHAHTEESVSKMMFRNIAILFAAIVTLVVVGSVLLRKWPGGAKKQ